MSESAGGRTAERAIAIRSVGLVILAIAISAGCRQPTQETSRSSDSSRKPDSSSKEDADPDPIDYDQVEEFGVESPGVHQVTIQG